MLFALANAQNVAEFEPGFHNFIANLSKMGLGMLGIFIVMGAIILSTVLLNKIFSSKNKKNDD